MIWGDEFWYTRIGKVVSRVVLGLWVVWVSILNPFKVERQLDRIEDLLIRVDGISWITEDRVIAMDDQLQTLHDEIVMWHAENKSLARLIHNAPAHRDTTVMIQAHRDTLRLTR